MNCRVCSTVLIPFFSLGDMPLVNDFLTKERIANEKKYDLSVGFCQKCYLAQLIHTVPPEELFTNYLYFSSTSVSFLEHCKKLAHYFTKRFNLGPESLVLEIASNDGAFLQYVKELNVQILGIDPAKNIAEIANQKGIPTMAEFFTQSLAEKLKKEKGIQADLLYGANVLAHVPEIVDFVKGVRIALKPQGTAIFEFPYINGLMENKFDTIYHEHVFYYSLIALQNLFQTAGLEIYDVELTPMQGGSLMIFAAHPGNFALTGNVKNLAEKEIGNGFDKIETYQKIEANISALKKDLVALLMKLKNEGKKIAGYSAPAKGNILLNYFGINENFLDFIVDKSTHKQGLYTPGTHLLVHPLSKIYACKTDYLLVLCWNIYEEVMIMEELKEFREAGGKFIVPIPSIKIY